MIAIDAIDSAQVTMANAAVQVTNEVDLSKINELRADTTGDITVDEVKETKENLTAINEFVAEQGVAGDVILSNSDITVTDVVNKSEAVTINAYNDQGGTVTLTSVTDLLVNVKALSTTDGISIATSDLKVTDTTTLADATVLDGYTTGEVTLDNVTDSFANVQSIHNLTPAEDGANGVDLTAAAITITDPISLEQTNTANGFSDGSAAVVVLAVIRASALASVAAVAAAVAAS